MAVPTQSFWFAIPCLWSYRFLTGLSIVVSLMTCLYLACLGYSSVRTSLQASLSSELPRPAVDAVLPGAAASTKCLGMERNSVSMFPTTFKDWSLTTMVTVLAMSCGAVNEG